MRTLARWAVFVTAAAFGGTFFYGAATTMLHDHDLYKLALQHFGATIGLPSAALIALCLVIFLEHTSGAIEFEALGFKFKGASGPVIMWILAFLAITSAIKMLW